MKYSVIIPVTVFLLGTVVLGGTVIVVGEHYNCTVSNNTKYECIGFDFPHITATLPNSTTVYWFTARYAVPEDIGQSVDLNAADFSHLTSLEDLQLSTEFECRLDITIGDVHREDIFAPLVNLKILKINIKWFMTYPLPGLFTPLDQLEILDLSDTRRVDMSNMIDSFQGLRNKTKLWKVNLWNVQPAEFAYNYPFLNLTEMLEPLSASPVTYLNLGYNSFRSIFPGLITHTPKLEHLVLSNNALLPLITSSLFLEIILHPTLRRVEMGEQGLRPAHVMQAPGPPKRCAVSSKTLNMNNVQQKSDKASRNISTHPALIWQPQPKNMEYIELLSSFLENYAVPALHHGVGIVGLNKCLLFQPQYKSLLLIFQKNHPLFCQTLYHFEYRTFGGIPCWAIPSITDMIREDCTGCMVVPLGPKLETIVMNQLNIFDEVDIFPDYRFGNQCFHENNNLKEVDFSKNSNYGFIGISDLVQTVPQGLEKMEIFDVSSTGLTAVNPFLFKKFPRLKVLRLAHNFLTFTQNYSQDLFINHKKLEFIDISYNRVQTFFEQQFSSLSHLKILNVSHNKLEEFDLDIGSLHNLTLLNLSANNLQGFSRHFTDQLTVLAENGQPITLDLSDNDIVCTCATVDFIDWLTGKRPTNIVLHNYEAYTCLDQNSNRVPLLKLNIGAIRQDCNKIRNIILGSVFGTVLFFIVIAIIVVAYIRRWRIRYYFNVAQQMLRRKQQIEADSKHYQYDAFVSYNQDDRFWVHNILRPKLEDECGLKTCLHFRDFPLGDFIADAIIDAIESSRKTILILSPNFLKSNWCKFEMHMARNKLFDKGTDILILVLLQPIPRVGVTRTLATLMETKVYIEWSEDEDAQRLFWSKLERAVRGPPETPLDV